MKIFKTTVIAGFTSYLLFAACNKSAQNTSAPDTAQDIALATEAASDETILSDDQQVMDDFVPFDATDLVSITKTATTDNCATVTVTPKDAFPKTITIDYGTGCTMDSVKRSGQIIITLSDYRKNPGSKAVTTFKNFYINDIHREGTITHTNTSTATARSWEVKMESVKVTHPDGKYFIHNATRSFMQIAGDDTPKNIKDDVFSITGSGTHTSSEGKVVKNTIVNALEKRNNCRWISKGTVKHEGPKHTTVVDFGNGNCDRIATASIDGGAPKEIKLP